MAFLSADVSTHANLSTLGGKGSGDNTIITIQEGRSYEESQQRNRSFIYSEIRDRSLGETYGTQSYSRTPTSVRTTSDSTAATSDLGFVRGGSLDHSGDSQDSPDEITRTRDARIALLCRDYAGDPEKAARLKILNERMNRLAPRVTDEMLRTLEHMASEAEDFVGNLDRIKRKYGIE